MLIGCNVPEVHVTIDKRFSGANEPCAIKTPLGWTLLGPCNKILGENNLLNCTPSTEKIEVMFEQFYKKEFDDASSHVPMSVKDRRTLSIMSESIQLVNGHYRIAPP
ncbi:unnamed protein product [Trichobilharzia regenti]|nr:unnamed protein product [Trichobilharzia regenti]